MEWNRIFAQAASEARAQVRRDCRRAGLQARRLLEYIENHLFDPQLTFKRMKQACNCKSHSTAWIFRQATGLPPMTYVREQRMQVAAAMLRATDIELGMIANAIGYGSIASFGRAYKAWAQESPGQTRRSRQANLEQPEEAATQATAQRGIVRPQYTQLDFAKFQELIDFLTVKYGDLKSLEFMRDHAAAAIAKKESVQPARGSKPQGCRDEEEATLEAFWQSVKDLSELEQHAAWRNRVALPEVLKMLSQTARKAGRINRRLGLIAAEDLGDLIEKSRYRGGGDDQGNLTARAWAWIGSARQLNLDLRGAQRAFERAERELPFEDRDSLFSGELQFLKGCLYRYLGELPSALECSRQAIDCFQRHGCSRNLIEALILRALAHYGLSEPEIAIRFLYEALSLCPHVDDPYLTFVVYEAMVVCYMDAEDLAKASAFAKEAGEVARAAQNKYLISGICWLEGRVELKLGDRKSAEDKLSLARQDFIIRGDLEHAASVALDLAKLCSEQGRHKEAVSYLVDSVPFFEALKSRPTGLAARQMLGAALEQGTVTPELVNDLWASAEPLRRDPTVHLDQEKRRARG